MLKNSYFRKLERIDIYPIQELIYNDEQQKQVIKKLKI